AYVFYKHPTFFTVDIKFSRPIATVSAESKPETPLVQGRDARVVIDHLIPVRSQPGTDSNVILLTIKDQEVSITDGPRVVEGQRWWEISLGQQRGWLPEK